MNKRRRLTSLAAGLDFPPHPAPFFPSSASIYSNADTISSEYSPPHLQRGQNMHHRNTSSVTYPSITGSTETRAQPKPLVAYPREKDPGGLALHTSTPIEDWGVEQDEEDADESPPGFSTLPPNYWAVWTARQQQNQQQEQQEKGPVAV